jgi:hypothetical protein
MPRFTKRPVEIRATQITRPMTIETLEGIMSGKPGDWLITGIKGEQYFCADDIFRATYDPIDDDASAALEEGE